MTTNNFKLTEVINQVVNDPDYKKVSAVPLFSTHQMGLILLTYLLVLGGIALNLFYQAPLWLVYPFIIFGVYVSFTPLHEATHRALSSNKFLNDFLGSVSAFLLLPFANTKGYRYIHMCHHRYVGDKTLDPDDPLVHIPTKYFPFGYLIFLIADYTWAYWLVFKVWKRTPIVSRVNILWMLLANAAFNLAWLLSPFWYEFFILYFIPARLGQAYIAFSFAHIQHPEGMKWHEHPFHSTFMMKGNFFYLKSLLGQSHHAMHHFLPHIPWYKYHKVLKLANGAFQKQSLPSRHPFSKPDKHYKDKFLKSNLSREKNELIVNVSEVLEVAREVKTFVFEALEGGSLPPFTAGAHINIELPSGKIRAYSLVNPAYENHRYQIAVKREAPGKGGSRELHDEVKVGDKLKVSFPQNNFLLYENVQKYILMAGGIGITPLISMAHRLIEIDKHFEFHICARGLDQIPFQYELNNWSFAPNVEIHLDKNGKSSLDLEKTLARPDKDTLIYVCGPAGFNHWIKETALSQGWSNHQIKQEVFAKNYPDQKENHSFELVLQKSGKSISVEKNLTIIDSLLLHNIKVEYTCLQGTCGTCLCPIVDGEADHRDAVLREEEKLENKQLCLCVSRAKGDRLVIDL
ncbi:MAG: fatty acid desaturase [Bacteroidota bacterium]